MILDFEENSRFCYRPDLCRAVLRLLCINAEIGQQRLRRDGPSPAVTNTPAQRGDYGNGNMEGGGEGMVAVVRGTNNAMTVTLISGNRGNCKRKCFDAGNKPTRVSLSSVETNTERNLGNVNAPMCDVKYVNRFPDYESPRVSNVFPQPISSIFGSQDLFTQSLRKYPGEKSSAELVQRIINYTRTKNYGKKRYSRSLRSLIRKSRSQTEARGDSNAEGQCGGSVCQTFSSNEGKDLSQNELVNYTYDYLKCSSLVPNHTDVRYFTEVKRAIRGRLRDIICDKPKICPWVQSRYHRHQQRYHRKSVSSAKDIETQESRNKKTLRHTRGSTFVRHSVSSNIVNCHSGINPCFCNRDSPCDDELFNRPEPVQNLFNLHPGENPDNEGTSQTDVADGIVTGKEILENVLNEWLKTVPVNYNLNEKELLRRDQVIDKLIKTLNNLRQYTDFIELAKIEVVKCLDTLPMWHPDDSENDYILKDQLADDLTKRLINVAEQKFKTAISEEVKKLPFDVNRINDKLINKTIHKFIDKLARVCLNRPLKDEDYKEKLKFEVISLLKDLPLQPDSRKSNQIYELADKFVERIYQYKIYQDTSKPAVEDIERNEFEKKINDWCTNILEFSTHKYNRSQYSDLVKILGNKFYKYYLNDPRDINVQIKLQNEVKEWLDQLTTRINIKLTPKRTNLLSKDLIEKIFGSYYASSKGNHLYEDAATSKRFMYIMEWYQNIPGTSDDNSMTEKIKELNFQLKNIQYRDDNFENILADMRDAILNWLQNNLNKKGIKLDSKIQDNLVNDLILKLHKEPAQENDGSKNIELYEDVMAWLNEIPFTKPHEFAERNNLVGEFVVRLMEIEKSSNEETFKNNVEEEIKNLINKLSENDDKNITDKDVEKLKLKVLTQMKVSPPRRKLWNKRNSNLRKTLYKEISNIVESCPLLPEKLKTFLKDKITNILLKNIKSNVLDAEKTISQVYDILKQETTLIKTDIEMLGKQIVDKVNDVLLGHESLHISPTTAQLTKLKLSNETNRSQHTSSVETDIGDNRSLCETSSQKSRYSRTYNTNSNKTNIFNNNRTCDTNVEPETENSTEMLRIIKQKLAKTFENNVTQTDDLQDHATNTINKYNENSKIDENVSKEVSIINNINKAAKLIDKKIEDRKFINKSDVKSANRSEHKDDNIQTKIGKEINTSFLEKDFSTSTPKTSSIKSPSVVLLSTTNTSFVTKINNIGVETSDTLQYFNKLTEIITNWLHHFPLNLNKDDKHDLINKIANDILERQRYIQLSEVNTIEKNELEHLKYQIFKRLHKLNNLKVIRDILSNVDCLNHRILTLKTPNLIQSVQEHKLHEPIEINQPGEDAAQTNIDESKNKISEWFEKFFPNFIHNLNEDKIQHLARNLENLKLRNNYDSYHIEKEIIQWISNILTNIDVNKLCDFAESLKKHLCGANITDTFILKQDTSEFVTENLFGAIIEWIRTTQYRYKLQKEIQDYFAMVLANDIKHVFAQSLSVDELNELLIQEIMKDLAMVTAESNHPAFHYAVACDLVQFLKELKIFHDLSERETPNELREKKVDKDTSKMDDIKQAVIKWFNVLPLQEIVTVREIENIINNFVHNIEESKLDDVLNNEDILKQYILRLLSKIPLKIDNQDIELQVASLVAKIKRILSPKKSVTKTTRDFELQVDINQEQTPSVVYKQLLYDTVSMTLLDKLTLEEQRSFNLIKEKLADAFIDLHHSTEDKDFRNEFKIKLYREISKYCDDYLKRRPVSRVNAKGLQEDLHNLLTNVSLPTIRSKTNVITQEQEENTLQENDFLVSENKRKNQTAARKDGWVQTTPQISQTSLSSEDIEHLQRIRKRSTIRSTPENIENFLPSNLPIKHYENVGIQSNVITNDKIPKSVQTSNASVIDNVPNVHREISPHVLIREYYWDSNGSCQSFQILKPPKVSTPEELALKTKTTKTQTEEIYNNKKRSLKEILKTKNAQESTGKEISTGNDIKTQTDDLQDIATNKSRYVLQSHLLEENYEEGITESQNISSEDRRNKINDTRLFLSKRREITDEATNKTFEKETTDHLKYFNKGLSKFNAPKSTTISENLPPIIITEKRSERRVYASPECVTNDKREGREGQICCNCKNHLLTQCRNKPYAGCRQVSTKNTLKHCSKCFGGHCPHPSYFFFKKDF